MNRYSIVIPAYNAQSTITDTVLSALQQSYEDIEVIVVNDGSTDDTADMLSRIDDPRLVVIDQDNGGPSAARNNGIDKATGNYILFLDSDDKLLPGIVDSIDEVVSKTPYDVVLFHSQRNADEQRADWLSSSFLLSAEDKKLLIESIYNKFQKFNDLLGFDAPWGKAISRKVIVDNGIRFIPDIRRYEDAAFCKMIYDKSNQIFCLDKTGYLYNNRTDSLCNSYNENIIEIITQALSRLEKLAPSRNLVYIKAMTSLSVIESQYLLNEQYPKSKKERKAEFLDIINIGIFNEAIHNISVASVPLHYRVEVVLLRLRMISVYLGFKSLHFKKNRSIR